MANKFIVVFLLRIMVAVAMYVPAAAVLDDDHFKSCFNTCHRESNSIGSGNTSCEMKCDSDCEYKEAAAKHNIHINA
ncbi:hypothetical protein SLEP1_g55372 [Rubroshorea leprosula]|uniref:Major pollen allergen Ole e 6-like n=1 Tax=Rubroshorea leprosula TaxID=152421 RepID=A0AAV5MGE1_9ROSI|nr:hypothetical protein SLEP1_g55372 [Rubroshorea leprosula]